MSKTHYVVGLGGTLRLNSRSRATTEAALRFAAERGAQTEMLDLRDLNLPMFVPDAEIHDYLMEHQQAIHKLIDATNRATAMVWCSPCYHGTVAGVFKNAIDFMEYCSGPDSRYLMGKIVGLIAINDSKTFGAMYNSVHELRAYLAPTHITLSGNDFNDQLQLTSERSEKRIRRLVDELLKFSIENEE